MEMNLFYMPRKRLRIRRGRGLLANDNPASTFPGQQSFKRRAKVSETSACCRSVYTRHLRDHYAVDRHWWPRIRAPRAQNGLRIRRRFSFEVETRLNAIASIISPQRNNV